MLRSLLSAALVLSVAAVPASAFFGTEPPPAPPVQTGAPMLEISKKCPQLRYTGREATFEITVVNRGTAAADNVVITDNLSSAVQFVNADNGGRLQGSAVVWNVGRLDVGATKSVNVTVRCDQIGLVRNVATVRYCVESSAMCEFPIRGIPAILLECVDDPDPIEVGAKSTYTIIVTNQGNQTGTNIVVECTLPAQEEFVDAGGATAATAEGKKVVFAPLATLAPKAKAMYRVTVKGVAEGDARFRVALSSDQYQSVITEDESTTIYE